MRVAHGAPLPFIARLMPRSVTIPAVLTVLLSSGAALAQGVCVDCKGPERTYNCLVKDAERAQQFRGGNRALQYLCISEIARTGKHESCRVGSGYAGPCIGHHYEIDVAKLGKDAVPVPPPADAAAAGADAKDKPADQAAVMPPPVEVRKGPPQTLEELARDTVTKSKAQLSKADESVKNAGDAVGGAVKKSWDCVVSLFKRC